MVTKRGRVVLLLFGVVPIAALWTSYALQGLAVLKGTVCRIHFVQRFCISISCRRKYRVAHCRGNSGMDVFPTAQAPEGRIARGQ